MKENRGLILVNIFLLCIIVVALLIFMFWGFNFNFYTGGIQELLKSEVYRVDDVTEVFTNLKDYDVVVEVGNSDEIKVELYGNEKYKDKISLALKSGIVEVVQDGSYVCFGFCYSRNMAKIYVPESMSKKVNLTTVSGDIEVRASLEDDNVNIKTTSGDIKAAYINKGKVHSTSGDIEVNKAKDLVVSSTSGEVEIDRVKNVDINTTSGDILIRNLEVGGDIKSTSGEIEIKSFNINIDSKMEAISGDITIFLVNEANVSASTVSGDKEIKNGNGEFNLDLKTVSGDILVR